VGKRRCRCGPFWPIDGDVAVTPRIKAGQVPDSWAFTKDPGRSLRGSSAGQRHQSDAFSDASLAEIVVQPEDIAEHRLADLHTDLTMLRKPSGCGCGRQPAGTRSAISKTAGPCQASFIGLDQVAALVTAYACIRPSTGHCHT